MGNNKAPYEKKKINKKVALVIIFLLTTAIIIQFFSQQIHLDSKETDEKIRNLIFSINISLFGIVFAIMAQQNMNKYLINAFGLLFVGILPIIALIPLILNPVTNLAAFFPFYLGVTFGWFFGVNHWVIGVIDDEEKAYAAHTMKAMLSYLLLIALGTFALYLLVLSFQNPPTGN